MIILYRDFSALPDKLEKYNLLEKIRRGYYMKFLFMNALP